MFYVSTSKSVCVIYNLFKELLDSFVVLFPVCFLLSWSHGAFANIWSASFFLSQTYSNFPTQVFSCLGETIINLPTFILTPIKKLFAQLCLRSISLGFKLLTVLILWLVVLVQTFPLNHTSTHFLLCQLNCFFKKWVQY